MCMCVCERQRERESAKLRQKEKDISLVQKTDMNLTGMNLPLFRVNFSPYLTIGIVKI